MSYISSIVSYATAPLSAYAQVQQGKQANEMAKYAAKVQQQNAATARQAAGIEASQIRTEGAGMLSTQQALAGGAGVTTEGSPLMLLSETAKEYDREAAHKMWEGETEAVGYEREADLLRAQGRTAKRAAYFSAAGTMFGMMSKKSSSSGGK